MPSSSTHNTYFEHQILTNFRKAYACLYYAPHTYANNVLSKQFCKVLDMPESELVDRIQPSYDSERQTEEQHKGAKAEWDKWIDDCKRSNHDQCIFAAAECVSSVGLELSKAGRAQEAGHWYEMSEDILRLATTA